jgi:hypothetical protein
LMLSRNGASASADARTQRRVATIIEMACAAGGLTQRRPA